MKKAFILLFLSFSYLGLAQETYTLSSNSKLDIDGTSTVHDWTVTANSMTGSVTLEKGLPRTIEFKVAVAEIISERGATMDKKMHDALKKEEHPQIIFKLSEDKDLAILKGKLTIAGKEKMVDIPVKMTTDSAGLKITGQQKITLQDYGIDPPSAMFGQIIVGDKVTVKFNLVFVKK